MQPGEPLWLDEDRTAALAYMEWLREDEATRCPRCRTRERDWVDPAGKVLRNPAWMVEVRHCYGCEALALDVDLDESAGQSEHRVFRPNLGHRMHPADDGA